MKRLALVATALFVLVPATQAQAAPDKTAKVEVGTPFTWDGEVASGLNLNYWGLLGNNATPVFPRNTCSDDIRSKCEVILLEFSNPLTQEEIDAGKVFKTRTATVTITNYAPAPHPASDFDLIAFESDAQGIKGTEVARDGSLDDPEEPATEILTFPVRTTINQPSVYILVEVVYFLVAQSGYDGTAQF